MGTLAKWGEGAGATGCSANTRNEGGLLASTVNQQRPEIPSIRWLRRRRQAWGETINPVAIVRETVLVH